MQFTRENGDFAAVFCDVVNHEAVYRIGIGFCATTGVNTTPDSKFYVATEKLSGMM